MNPDSLAELLRRADDAAPPPPAPAGLAEKVRRRARVQSRRRLAAAALLLPLVLIAAVVWKPHSPWRESVPVTTTIQFAPPVAYTASVEATRLRAEASLRISTVDALRSRLARREKAERARQLLAGAEVPDSIAAERDRAALTMLDHADRLRRDLKQLDAALAAYRRTVDLFPETRWAAVARKRIEQLKPDARGAGSERAIA